MKFPLYIARRYLFSKSKNNAINIITLIAGIGVFAGALALFIVLSGFSGLKAFSVQFTNNVDPDLKVLPKEGKVIQLDEETLEKLKATEGVQRFSKVIEERVLLSYDNRSTPAVIKGVDENFNKVTSTDQSLSGGSWPEDHGKRVVIGSGIATNLSMGIRGFGDVLELGVPKPGKGQVTDPHKAFKTISTTVEGIYDINEDLNDKYVFTAFSIAQNLLSLKDDEVSAIELQLAPDAKEKTVKAAVSELFNGEVDIKNRIQLNDELYKMLNTENLAVYLIFTLVLIIALFNVGGAIVMAILDKRENIKTLFRLGAHDRKIKRIFFLQGSLLTFIGGVLGLVIGIIVVLLQQIYGFLMITESLSYPVELRAENAVVVFITIMVLGLIASYIGATRVTKVLNQ